MENLDVQQIGRYQLLDVIGKGGMGIVYRAIDTTIERKVAIKMLLGEGGKGDNDLLARFYREVRSTANLQHKNIVTVYALDDFDGMPYMVMEYLEGQSIAQMIASRQPVPIIEKIALICQVCEGLQYAHDRNVIHRDVKPANILVLKDGVAKIVDFGIARVGRSDNLTRTGQIVGSIYYMSPEQTTGVLDSRSDIYSTGVTLFEFLTGEVPFKGSDTQSTLLKILHDPVPSLNRYSSNYPKALDAILSRAMAKEAAERYQTAEDFVYDLTQLQDSLKREMTDEFLAQAKRAMEERAWDTARQKLQEILRFDRRSQPANELYKVVREQIQLQQRDQQIQQLRSQAEIALVGLQYEEALECIEQAKRLAPDDQELERLSRSISAQLERARELSEALRRGQAALYAGDLSEAGLAVQRALELDGSNTEALTLDTLVRKEAEDRMRRAKLQGLLDEARKEISARNFLSALRNLEKAQSIDPSDSNIRELLSWAASGHQQEKQRIELRRCTDEIGKMVAEDRYEEATAACEAALQRFPDDIPLRKLYSLAKRQSDTRERRRVIEEISLSARSLIDSEQPDEAIRLLESSLERFPAEPNLEMLLEITRSEAEQGRKEREDRAREINDLTLDEPSDVPENDTHRVAAELLTSLENALSRRLPMPRMERIALQLKELVGISADGLETRRIQLALAEYAARAKSWEDARAELDALSREVEDVSSLSQTDSALERARLLLGQYPRDEIIRQGFETVRSFAEQSKARREIVRVQILNLLQFMQSSHNIGEIEKSQKQIQEASFSWAQDDLIRNLLDQATACAREARQRRTSVLKELSLLRESISTAKSMGQVRFLKEQAKMLQAEIDDPEVSLQSASVERIANALIDRIGISIDRLTDLNTKAISAPTLDALRNCEQNALELVKSHPDIEELVDLNQRIHKLVEDRTREYKRIETSFEQLISRSKDAGKAELETIEARQRILHQKYPEETSFQELQHRLRRALEERFGYLKSTAALSIEQDNIEELEEEEPTSEGEAVELKHVRRGTRFGAKVRRRLIVVGLVIVATVFAFLTIGIRATVTFSLPGTSGEPTLILDGKQCANPCRRRLFPGQHIVKVQLAGYEDLVTSFEMSRFEDKTVTLTMTRYIAVQNGPEGGTPVVHAPAKTPPDSYPNLTSGKSHLPSNEEVSANQKEIKSKPTPPTPQKPSEIGTPSAISNTAAPSESALRPATNTVPVPMILFSASQLSIVRGQGTQLNWQTQNATDVQIDGKSVSLSGSMPISPQQSTAYVLSAKGPGGPATQQVHIIVTEPTVPTVSVPISSDQAQIRMTLNLYKQAYENESLDDMKRVWPQQSKGSLKNMKKTFEDFNAIHLELNCTDENIKIHGDVATANCQEIATYSIKGKKQPPSPGPAVFTLKKQGGSWILEDVR